MTCGEPTPEPRSAASSPVLVLATAEDPVGSARGGDARLAPLCADDVLAIARHYAPRSEIPVELLLEATGGVPAAVHRTAAEWARAEAEKRLGGAAGRAAAGRSGLRVAEDDLAGSVVELQALRERALPARRTSSRARSRASPPSMSRTPACSSAASGWSPR